MAIEDTGFGIQSITLRDNSIRSVDTTSVLSILPSLHPVFSSDGKDNVLYEVTNMDSVLESYGDDFLDMNTYGQQNLNVQKSLEGGSSAYLCRLLPDDAKRSHLVVKVAVKANEAIPLYKRDQYGDFLEDENGNKIPLMATQTVTETTVAEGGGEATQSVQTQVAATTTGIQVKVVVEQATEKQLQKFTTLRQLQNAMKAVTVDDEGYKVIPLFFMSYYANGKCGNNYGVRIVNDFARDAKVTDGHRYQMYLVKKSTSGAITLTIGNGLAFSFNPYATVSKTTTTIEGLQKVYSNYDDNNQEKQIQIETYLENYDKLDEAVKEILGQEAVTTQGLDPDYTLRVPSSTEELDFINGYDREGYPFDNVVVADNSVNMSNPQYMAGGSDGCFETLTGDELTAKKNELLKSFFNGDIDTKNILNVLKCDAGIMFDANYDLEVKKAMINLLNWRRDICAVLDCGFTENLSEAVAVAKEISSKISGMGEGGENYAIAPHCGITADRTVNVRVTDTYEFAYGLMHLYNSHPFSVYAGKPNDYGCVRKTIFDWVVEESKPVGYEQKLAKKNKLYWATDLGKAMSSVATGNVTGRNVYWYSNASQYSEEISKLAEFRNGILVNDIRRILKLVLVKYTFDTDGADSSIEKATSELTSVFSSRYPSNVVINLNLYQSDRDKLLNQATCEVEVLFPDIFETWNCVIIADRQNS